MSHGISVLISVPKSHHDHYANKAQQIDAIKMSTFDVEGTPDTDCFVVAVVVVVVVVVVLGPVCRIIVTGRLKQAVVLPSLLKVKPSYWRAALKTRSPMFLGKLALFVTLRYT